MRLIDADVILEELSSCVWFRKQHHMDTKEYESFARFIEGIPTSNPVTLGKWVRNGYNKDPYCNVCGGIAPVDCTKEDFYESDFCPNCGADMRGE